MAHVATWEPYNLHGLGQVSWVAYALYIPSTTSPNGRLGSSMISIMVYLYDVCKVEEWLKTGVVRLPPLALRTHSLPPGNPSCLMRPILLQLSLFPTLFLSQVPQMAAFPLSSSTGGFLSPLKSHRWLVLFSVRRNIIRSTRYPP